MDQKIKYDEVINLFDETFQEYKDRNMSNLEALAKTFEDFELIMNSGDIQKATVLIRYGEFVLKQPYVYSKSKDLLVGFLNKINYELLKIELSDQEYQDLIERKNKVIHDLEKKELTHNSRAMWYYDEMTSEVNRYYDSITAINKTVDQISKQVLERFSRDCRNTRSEEIVVYTTLSERLLQGSDSNNLIHSIELIRLQNKLKEFNIDVIGEQLSVDEKLKLQTRVEEVLKYIERIL